MALLVLLKAAFPYLLAGVAFPWVQWMHPAFGFGLWAIMGPLLYTLLQVGSKRRLWARVVVQLGLSLGMAVVHAGLGLLFMDILIGLEGGAIPKLWQMKSLMYVIDSFIAYWIIQGGFMGVDLSNRYRDKMLALAVAENRATSAQLVALKMQLNPHFLFNALNSVGALMDISVKEAQRVLARLGGLLRITLESDQRHTTRLADEVNYLKHYLELETVRFGDRLETRFDIPQSLQRAVVPNLILQPLVENAIKHGFSSLGDCGWIAVEAERRDDRLVMRVCDNGDGCDDVEAAFKACGVGTRNVSERLASLYGEDFRFRFLKGEPVGFIAEIEIAYCEDHPELEKEGRGRS